MNFQELLDKRYSLRKFESAPVERPKLDAILEAGRIAPTAGNRQPVRVMVVQQAADLLKIDECTPCRYGAPLVLIVCYDKTVCWRSPFKEWDSGEVDSSIVTTYMMLKAEEAGLGTLWVMKFDPAKASELFMLPESLAPVAMLMIGSPAEGAAPSDYHAKRNPVEQMLI